MKRLVAAAALIVALIPLPVSAGGYYVGRNQSGYSVHSYGGSFGHVHSWFGDRCRSVKILADFGSYVVTEYAGGWRGC